MSDDVEVTFRLRASHAAALLADLARRHQLPPAGLVDRVAEDAILAAYESILATLRMHKASAAAARAEGSREPQH